MVSSPGVSHELRRLVQQPLVRKQSRQSESAKNEEKLELGSWTRLVIYSLEFVHVGDVERSADEFQVVDSGRLARRLVVDEEELK